MKDLEKDIIIEANIRSRQINHVTNNIDELREAVNFLLRINEKVIKELNRLRKITNSPYIDNDYNKE